MDNFPANLSPQDYDDIDTCPDLHRQAGLIDVGLDEDGLIEWGGTKEQWKKYHELEEADCLE